MKKIIAVFLLLSVFALFSGCSNPDSLQLDLSQGFAENLKLIHLNASSEAKRERISEFQSVIENAAPIDKPFDMFAYYPDYMLEISPWKESGQTLTVIVDINGEHVDFYYPGPYPERSKSIYRSHVSAEEFRHMVHSTYS